MYGNLVPGYPLYSPNVEELPDSDFVTYTMMQTAVLELADFAPW